MPQTRDHVQNQTGRPGSRTYSGRLGGFPATLLALLVAAGVVLLVFTQPRHKPGVVSADFDLITQQGRRLSSRDLAGQPYVAVFGYTQCPDICPTTLQEIGTLISDLGADADKLRYLFFTVDPERDTQDVLKFYLSGFDPRIIGLTGSLDQVSAAAKSFRAFFQKVPSSGSYTMNHTASVYLMDARGTLVSTMSLQDPEDAKVARLKSLMR